MDKKETLEALYALRAGMSVASAVVDEYDGEVAKEKEILDNTIRELNIELADSQGDLAYKERADLKKCESNLENLRQKKSDNDYDAHNNYSEIARDKKHLRCKIGAIIMYALIAILGFTLTFLLREKSGWFLFFAFSAISIAGTLGWGIYLIIYARNEYELKRIFFGIPYILGIIAVFACAVASFFISLFGIPTGIFNARIKIYSAITVFETINIIFTIVLSAYNAEQARYHERSWHSAETSVTELNKEIEEAQKKVNGAKIVLREAERKSEHTKEETEKKHREQVQKAQAKYDDACKYYRDVYFPIRRKMMDDLTKKYAKIIDIRDWENVDLVIYYFETGRVDSIKEALLQVDLEKRNERIVNSMEIATLSLTRTVNFGFGELESQLNKGLNGLAKSLNSAKDEIIGRIDSTAVEVKALKSAQQKLLSAQEDYNSSQQEMLDSIKSKLAALSSQEGLQKALLEKSNETSKKIMDKISKIDR